MHESVKTVLLAAIGALALSYEKAAGLVDDLVNKGQITVAEGKQINEELRRTMTGKMKGEAAGHWQRTSARTSPGTPARTSPGASPRTSPGTSPGPLPGTSSPPSHAVSSSADGDRPLTPGGLREVLRDVLNELGLVTRADIEELHDRLSRLEKSGGGVEK